MNANKTLGFVLTAAICAVMSVHADALPWDGTRLVFGEAQRGGTFTLDAPATASEVDFLAPATLQGAELTLTSPALVRGGGALLTPLAGTDGVVVGWPVQTHAQFFAQATYQTLWNDVDLSTVSNVTGNICGHWAGQRLTPCIAVAFKRLNAEGTSATVQIQSLNQGAGNWVRCFKIQLEQDGADVKAKALWCKYASYPEKASYYGRDWDDPDIQANGAYSAPYSTSIVGSGGDIGLTNVKPLFDVDLEGTLPSGTTVLNGRRVTFRPTQAITVASSLTGDVQEVVFKGNILDVREYHQDGWVMTNEEVLVAQNTSIATIRFKSAIMCGNWVACDDPSLFSTYSTISGDTLTMQVQCYTDNGPGNQYTKVVFVEFRQAGKDVYMKAVAMGSKPGDYRGTNISRNDSPVCTAGSLSDRSACNGLLGKGKRFSRRKEVVERERHSPVGPFFGIAREPASHSRTYGKDILLRQDAGCHGIEKISVFRIRIEIFRGDNRRMRFVRTKFQGMHDFCFVVEPFRFPDERRIFRIAKKDLEGDFLVQVGLPRQKYGPHAAMSQFGHNGEITPLLPAAGPFSDGPASENFTYQ